jgi:hypothetical protein
MITIQTGTLPEIDGNPIERLVVLHDGEPLDSVIIGNPMTLDCAIEKLELLAWRLRLIKEPSLANRPRFEPTKCDIPQSEASKAQELSAKRWDALINSARIRALGSAGLNSELSPNGQPWNNYAHLGVELWTKHDEFTEDSFGKAWLEKYADIAIAAQEK